MSNVPPSDQMRAAGSARRKVALAPGRSQLDWIRKSRVVRPASSRTITLAQLKRHRSKADAWIAIRGNVYDITQYLEYHPGGVPMIMAGAGKDATELFNKYHMWVNPEFMLSKCFLGVLDDSDDGNMVDDGSPNNNRSTTSTRASPSSPSIGNHEDSTAAVERRLRDMALSEIDE